METRERVKSNTEQQQVFVFCFYFVSSLKKIKPRLKEKRINDTAMLLLRERLFRETVVDD